MTSQAQEKPAGAARKDPGQNREKRAKGEPSPLTKFSIEQPALPMASFQLWWLFMALAMCLRELTSVVEGMSSGLLGLAFVVMRLLAFRVLKSWGSQWRNQRPGISERMSAVFGAGPPQEHATLFTHTHTATHPHPH